MASTVALKSEMKTHTMEDWGFAITVSSSIAWSMLLLLNGAINHADVFLTVQGIWVLFSMMTEAMTMFRLEARIGNHKFINCLNMSSVSYVNMRSAMVLRGISVLFQIWFFERSSYLLDLIPVLEMGTIATAVLEMSICAKDSLYSSTCCSYLLVLKWVMLRFALSYCAVHQWVDSPMGNDPNILSFFGSITFFTAVFVLQGLWAFVLLWNLAKRVCGARLCGVESLASFVVCELPEEAALRKMDAVKNWEDVHGGLFRKVYTRIFNQVKTEMLSQRETQQKKWSAFAAELVVRQSSYKKFATIVLTKVANNERICKMWKNLQKKNQQIQDGLAYVDELVDRVFEKYVEAEEASKVVVGNAIEIVLIKAAEIEEDEYVVLESEDTTEYCSSAENEEVEEEEEPIVMVEEASAETFSWFHVRR